MGERKVLNKYIPADFDPKLVPRGKKPKDDLVPVRMMLPFSVQCNTCSTFLYRGRKFNSKKEAVKGPEGKYLGIQRFRFYIKCTACSRPITFLTDPKNTDYEMESGATRNYEVHKDRVKKEEENLKEQEMEEKEDPMKALENRVLASQREMADLDNLDEIKAMNMRHLKMMSSNNGKNSSGGVGIHGLDSTAAILSATRKNEEEHEIDTKEEIELDEEDEALIKSIKFGATSTKKRKQESEGPLSELGSSSIVRLGEAEEEEMRKRRKRDQELFEKQQMDIASKANSFQKKAIGLNPLIKVKKKKLRKNVIRQKIASPPTDLNNSESSSDDNGGALGMLGGYGSDSS